MSTLLNLNLTDTILLICALSCWSLEFLFFKKINVIAIYLVVVQTRVLATNVQTLHYCFCI